MTATKASNVRAADDAAIDQAAGLLTAGGLVAFPTETVYGLGADACNGEAVARIFEAKGRPQFNPLIVHLADTAQAEAHASFTETAIALARDFWPGPLTMVLPRRDESSISHLVSGGGKTIALRVPQHPIAQSLLGRAGCPVAAPSANRSGGISSTTAGHVLASLGDRVDLILDGGRCPGGLESTIVDLTGDTPLFLRPGLIERAALSAVAGEINDPPEDGSVRAPGMLASHYAPRADLRLNAAEARPGEALLAFGPGYPETGPMVRNLSHAGDLIEAASNLFSMLHELDQMGIVGIAATPVPDIGLGVAINDRLARAAAPRPGFEPALPEA